MSLAVVFQDDADIEAEEAALLSHLPFVVFFDIEQDRVVVWAVAHTKRDPGYWIARRPPSRTP